MRRLYFAAWFLTMIMAGPAQAGVFADDLGRCTTVATTQEDRTALIRWMFVVASANPAIGDMASISAAQRRQAFHDAASVFERVLLHACRREAVAALRNEGGAGIEAGFRTLGYLAGREMMNSPAGTGATNELVGLMNRADLEALGREAGLPAPPHPTP